MNDLGNRFYMVQSSPLVSKKLVGGAAFDQTARIQTLEIQGSR